MGNQIHENRVTSEDWYVYHPVTAEDVSTMAAIRAVVQAMKGGLRGIAARAPYDAIMERVTAPDAMTYEPDTVGGISGVWCKPTNVRAREVVLHIHGGWFNWGSAQAFRHMVGHIAASAGVPAFIPDYRLAPEHPFPSAADDVRAAFLGLIERGFEKIAVTGDSAGGNLALGLAASLSGGTHPARIALVSSVALSPVTDLSMSGESWTTRADADPYFTASQVSELVRSYLAGYDASNPLASPIHAEMTGLPPIRIHVGDDEVLLSDSIDFVERAVAVGVDARVDVWQGMVHGFLGSVGRLAASAVAIHLIGEFLTQQFAAET